MILLKVYTEGHWEITEVLLLVGFAIKVVGEEVKNRCGQINKATIRRRNLTRGQRRWVRRTEVSVCNVSLWGECDLLRQKDCKRTRCALCIMH